jgi:decaprenyl-phosphate phosphoribosyltransferase
MCIDWNNILLLLRLNQYIKNVFIFLPLFFGLKIADPNLFLKATIAFIAFSLISSAVYIFNDFHDIKEDRLHPKKKHRPLASGVITKPQSIVIMLILLLLGFALASKLPLLVTIIMVAYVVMNILYTLYLKQVALLDVTIIAIGFVMRIFVGSYSTDVPLSKWIIIMTFLLALFMALAKRRDDVLIFLNTGDKMRKVVDSYNLQFLDTAMAIMAAVVIAAYTVYCMNLEVVEKTRSEHLYLTVIFVILGIMRYLLIVFVKQDSGSPTKIVLKDSFIQLTILCWGLSFVLILY